MAMPLNVKLMSLDSCGALLLDCDLPIISRGLNIILLHADIVIESYSTEAAWMPDLLVRCIYD